MLILIKYKEEEGLRKAVFTTNGPETDNLLKFIKKSTHTNITKFINGLSSGIVACEQYTWYNRNRLEMIEVSEDILRYFFDTNGEVAENANSYSHEIPEFVKDFKIKNAEYWLHYDPSSLGNLGHDELMFTNNGKVRKSTSSTTTKTTEKGKPKKKSTTKKSSKK